MSLEIINITQDFSRILGTLLSLFGTIVVRYPDINNRKVRRFVEYSVPMINSAENLKGIKKGKEFTNKREIRLAEQIFKKRYKVDLPDSKPIKVGVKANSFYIEYENGVEKNNNFKGRETGQMEKRDATDWIIRRVSVNEGMKIVSIGFTLLLLSAIVSII